MFRRFNSVLFRRYAVIFTSRVQGVLILLKYSPYIKAVVGSRVVSVLDSGAEGPGFKSQPQRCRVTVLGKLFTPIVPLFTKQQNW